MTQSQTAQTEFSALGVNAKLSEILSRNKFITPTPIQAQTIPIGIEGKDVMGIAQTGTGKTLAFGIPMIQRMAQHGGNGLIVVPTRELAIQVNDSIQQIGRHIGLRTAVLIGGENIQRQFRQLERKPHIVVGTPGRLNDHLQQGSLSLTGVKVLVLDEADRMLDMGFLPQIQKILQFVPKERQTMLFSATMPDTVVRIATATMRSPIRIEVSPAGTAAQNVTHELFLVSKENKNRLLEKLLKDYQGTVLVFCRTKFGAKRVTRAVQQFGHRATEIHSNRSLGQRRDALDGFKSGKYRVLIATDIAARGIDVKGIEVVLNYDLPQQAEDYVHRIGRTGRAGEKGRAISFALVNEHKEIRQIERVIREKLPVSALPELPPHRPILYPERGEARDRRRAPARTPAVPGRSGFIDSEFAYRPNTPANPQAQPAGQSGRPAQRRRPPQRWQQRRRFSGRS